MLATVMFLYPVGLATALIVNNNQLAMLFV